MEQLPVVCLRRSGTGPD